MRFSRRRSSLTAESIHSESEPRRRNRLSKPLTGNATKIPTNPSVVSLQVSAQSKNASTTELAPISPLSTVSGNALRQQIRSEMLAPGNDNHSPAHHKKTDSSWSVAYMINQIEGKAESEVPEQQEEALPPQPPSPTRPQPIKRKSLLLRTLSSQRISSLSSNPSNERLDSVNSEMPASSSPNASLDRIVESPAIPPTRRSSFTPGAATRGILSRNTSKQDLQPQEVIEEADESEESVVESEYFDVRSQLPRSTGRAGTPSDMGYGQLGGLRHGSLQVVNGRASPAFSEISKMSKQLLVLQTPYRDVSSEYGDDENELEEIEFPLYQTTSNDTVGRRIFSWEEDDDQATPRAHPLHHVVSSHEDNEGIFVQDHTSHMANEYMAELGASPYGQQRSDSPVGTLRRTRSEGSLWRESSCSIDEDLSGLSPVSPLDRTPSPSGSVIHNMSTATVKGPSQELGLTTGNDRAPCGSVMTWYSPVEASMTVDEAFQSAVEFQTQLSPSLARLRAPGVPEKSDSGYSSSNSLRSLQFSKRTPPPAQIEALPEIPPTTSTSTLASSRPTSFLGPRPSILKSRKTEPNVPTYASLRTSGMSSIATPAVTILAEPALEASKPLKARKKLMKKRRPLSQPPGQISIMRVESVEQFNIPQVTSEARENLRMRSQAVPELEQTYARHNSEGDRPSSSNVDLPITEFRFPSPGPDQEPATKRPRSRSRPRSWFGRTKTEMSSSRCNSGISQVDAIAIINDFGTDGAVLGRSHYDFGDQATLSQPSEASSVVSTVNPYSRSMMDDETAVEVSRRRSRSLRERDGLIPERRPSFNDRGGIPGRHLRPTSMISDAPPITAEMIAKAYRTSSMQRHSSMTTDVAPPPPPHSLRPVYVEDDHSPAVAPPPPSHSPRPIDVTPDPWATQAAAWKARRKSAGAALRRQSWGSQKYEENCDSGQNEPLYPPIPSKQQPNWTETFSPEKFPPYPQHDNRYHDEFAPQQNASRSTHEVSYQRPNEHQSTYVRQSRQNSMAHDTQYHHATRSRDSSRHRPLPSSRSSSRPATSRPHSKANSVRSFASSKADQIHTQSFDTAHPLPPIGRYSGGLEFGYEQGNGFGGSAGTKSANGSANVSRKGVALRASYGVDLGDVPFGIMA